MRAILTVFLIAMLTVAAHAQGGSGGGRRSGQQPTANSEAAKKQREAADKAYKSALDKIPNKPAADPWGNVRQTPAATSAKNLQKSHKSRKK